MFFRRNSFKKTLGAFFLWLSGIATDKDAALVSFSGRDNIFYFDFPLRYGDKPKRTKTLPAGREITFFVRRPGNVESVEESEWINIFSSPEWKIFEKKTRFGNTALLRGVVGRSFTTPLRWRLNEEEKKTALKVARNALEKFLADGQWLEQSYFRNLPSRFHFKTDLDVAIWVKGQLRGSAVVESVNLSEGIAEAAIRASCDKRFKPLSKEELAATRIEITIIQNLFVPLSIKELKQNRIYPDKGYFLQNGERKGWFLPEVFNVRRFSSLDEFLAGLGNEKAGLPQDGYKSSEIFIFEVDDFIESEDHKEILSLFGPVVKSGVEFNPNSKFQILDSRLRLAADWLCRIQESDGNIPPIINSLTGKQTQIDWPRLAFTAWALAEFGKTVREKKYLLAAEKSFDYLRKYLIPDTGYLIPSYELTLAYFGRLCLAFGKPNDAVVAAGKIFERLNNLSFEPILFSQIASFLKVLPGDREKYSKALETICGMLKSSFEKNMQDNASMSPVRGAASNGVNLALWAELVNVFSGLDEEFSNRVADWLKQQQLPNGAFPDSTISDFVYVRGTGKILEVLALEPKKNKEAIETSLEWLLSTQYNDENTFFVLEEIRPRIIGGFRHDYFNQEAWIDATGHILLGAARLTTRQ